MKVVIKAEGNNSTEMNVLKALQGCPFIIPLRNIFQSSTGLNYLVTGEKQE